MRYVKSHIIHYINEKSSFVKLTKLFIEGYKIEEYGYDNFGYYYRLSKIIIRNDDEVNSRKKFWRHKMKNFYKYEIV